MSKHYQTSTAIIATLLLLSSLSSYACENTNQSTLEKEKAELVDLNKTKTPTSLYNFRTGHCEPMIKTPNDLEITAYLPADETTLGIYQFYRDKGEDKIDALKHTLQFDITAQQDQS